jgi:hypothetical protein
MTDVRAVTKSDGIGALYKTYKIDGTEIVYSATAPGGSAQVGLAVALSADDTVDLCGDGEPVHGKLIAVEADGFCTVQIRGFCTLPGGTSATLTVGSKIVGDLLVSAKGYVQTFAASSTVTAAEVTTAATTKGQIINNDVTTAVVVDLG